MAKPLTGTGKLTTPQRREARERRVKRSPKQKNRDTLKRYNAMLDRARAFAEKRGIGATKEVAHTYQSRPIGVAQTVVHGASLEDMGRVAGRVAAEHSQRNEKPRVLPEILKELISLMEQNLERARQCGSPFNVEPDVCRGQSASDGPNGSGQGGVLGMLETGVVLAVETQKALCGLAGRLGLS